MFLIVAICVMVMITLRASWLRHIEEEKVYHDEDEVAENMILDEHEEYLAYISRYKHEWQEYGGFEENGVDDGYLDDETEEGYDDQRSYDGSAEDCSAISGLDSSVDDERARSAYRMNNAVDGAVFASDDISFPSLSGQRSVEERAEKVRPEDFMPIPAPLLPPPVNPELYNGPNDVSLLPPSATSRSRSSAFANPSPPPDLLQNMHRSSTSELEYVRRKGSNIESSSKQQRAASTYKRPANHIQSFSGSILLPDEEEDFEPNFDELTEDIDTGEVEVRLSPRKRHQ
jgi:hypothetical protein